MSSSAEEQAIRVAIAAWGRARWPGCRIIHELVLGERRVDMVFVCERDVIGIEIKSSIDKLDRLAAQMKEYSRYFPELWVAAAARWFPQVDWPNRLELDYDRIITDSTARRRRPSRDELVCSRLLELLWRAEAVAIAQRTQCYPGPVHSQIKTMHILKLLARLLTGNEIIAEVCRELRARPLTGAGSDAPVREQQTRHAISTWPLTRGGAVA